MEATTPTVHSRIGASSMHRWAECPGSVKASEGMPNTSSKYAEEGTTAHDLAAKMILGEDITSMMIAVTDPEDPRYVSDEMIEAVEVYVDAFNKAKEGAAQFWVEERFDLSSLHPGLFGTSDGIIYDAETKTLEVWDYKHGAGMGVEVENNPQLMYYGLGALLKTKVPVVNVKLVICQPRYPHSEGPIRSFTVSSADIIEFAADLIEFAKATEAKNAPRKSGDHCKFCPAAPVCTTLHDQAVEAAKSDFAPSDEKYDPVKLSATLEKLPAIKAWVKSLEAFAFAEAERGRIPPGFKLVPKRATRDWRDPESARAAIALELGLTSVEISKPAVLRSPAQIEALLKSKEDKKFLESLVVKESSGNKLVPEGAKGEPVKAAIEADFKVIE